jgi:hypothetical protein
MLNATGVGNGVVLRGETAVPLGTTRNFAGRPPRRWSLSQDFTSIGLALPISHFEPALVRRRVILSRSFSAVGFSEILDGIA